MVSISQETMANVVGEKGRLSKTMSTVSASLSSKASAVPGANIRTYYPKKSIKKPFDYFTDDVKEGLIEKFPNYTRHKISLMIVDKWKKLNETTKS